jgi:hypothetical protein
VEKKIGFILVLIGLVGLVSLFTIFAMTIDIKTPLRLAICEKPRTLTH